MKKYIILLCASVFILSSCSDFERIDNSAKFLFDLNDSGEISTVTSEDNTFSQSTLGSVGLKGRYTARAIEKFVNKTNIGVVLNLPVELNADKEFSLEVFESLFAPQRSFLLAEQLIGEASLYYLKLDDGVVKTYGSVSRGFIPNELKVISRDYVGKSEESGNRMHKVVFEFSSDMINMDDNTDKLTIENGVIEVMVSEFNN